ncbi:MAG: arsenate reductase ArsC [Betaproteobacteria bacterium]|nr:arsenate reductase ArsC [Betaproteobacteria bacterium]
MKKIFKVLVLCTGNSARSILGEMLFKHLGKGHIEAWSAGSKPGGVVNPMAIETLQKHGVPCEGARSKSWDEFAVPPAPSHKGIPVPITFDFIFTVCGNAAQETCPVWPGHPATAHWGISDPAHVEPIEARRKAFEEAYQSLKKRIEAFVALPLERMSRDEILAAARRIHTGD